MDRFSKGTTAPGFEPVRDAFEGNFAAEGDLGAAFCLYVAGRKVVDLWGGLADQRSGQEWKEDTAALVFSTTKGVTAVCAHVLGQRGQLDLDAPVAQYWPEFARAGKEATTVRDLLSHRAGLPTLEPRLTPEAALAWEPAVENLAAQTPLWEPGTRHGYHAITYGWLVGEVIRRATGKTTGRFVADEIARPLGLDLWIGLPEAEEGRVARLRPAERTGLGPEAVAELSAEERDRFAAVAGPGSLAQRALNPTDPPFNFNRREVHAAELPGANAIATARALAALYATTVGEVEGLRLLEPSTVAAAVSPRSAGLDAVLGVENRFGSGFSLPSVASPLLGPRSFGHGGAGGSLAFADADHEVGFAYVMNGMRQGLTGDPRALALVEATRLALTSEWA